MVRKMNLPKPLFSVNGRRAVLLLHAYSGSPNDVRMLSRYLESFNYTVYSPMFRGHGTLAPEDILAQSPEVWWEDAQAAIAFLKEQGFEQIAVFGLSMGGIFAMKLLESAATSIIGGGTFCAPLFPFDDRQVRRSFMRYSEYQLNQGDIPESEQQKRMEAMNQKLEAQLLGIQNQSSEVQSRLQTVQSPVFLAQAGQDELIPASGVFQTAEKLVQTAFSLHWYPRSTHVITVGIDHKQLEQDVHAFLETLQWNEEN